MINPQPFISITIPVTRYWALDDLFYCLDNLICDHQKTELIFYLDTNDPRVLSKCSNYTDNSPFTRTFIKESGNPGPSEVRIAARRDRIVATKEAFKSLLSPESDYVFGIEDDSLFPPDTLQRLLPAAMRADVGFVEGVQVGRWGVKMIGAWRVNDLDNPTKILSMPAVSVEGKEGNRYLENIDAGGFYCYLTKTILYKGATYQWHDECFGADVCYGLDLRRLGYKVLIDWSLVIGHNDHGNVLVPDSRCEQVMFNKINDKWVMVKRDPKRV